MNKRSPITKKNISELLNSDGVHEAEVDHIIFTLEKDNYFNNRRTYVQIRLIFRKFMDILFASIGVGASLILSKDVISELAAAIKALTLTPKGSSSYLIGSAYAGDFGNKIAENIDSNMMKIGVAVIFAVTIIYFVINLFVWVFSKDVKSKEDANSHMKQIVTFMIGIFVGKA